MPIGSSRAGLLASAGDADIEWLLTAQTTNAAKTGQVYKFPDESGYLLVCGDGNSGSGDSQTAFTKVNKDGVVQWQTELTDGGAEINVRANGYAIGGDNNVYFASSSSPHTIVKINGSTGAVDWTIESNNGFTGANIRALDADDTHVYILQDSKSAADVVTVSKISFAGSVVSNWAYDFQGSSGSSFGDVWADSSELRIFTGWRDNGGTDRNPRMLLLNKTTGAITQHEKIFTGSKDLREHSVRKNPVTGEWFWLQNSLDTLSEAYIHRINSTFTSLLTTRRINEGFNPPFLRYGPIDFAPDGDILICNNNTVNGDVVIAKMNDNIFSFNGTSWFTDIASTYLCRAISDGDYYIFPVNDGGSFGGFVKLKNWADVRGAVTFPADTITTTTDPAQSNQNALTMSSVSDCALVASDASLSAITNPYTVTLPANAIVWTLQTPS